MSDDEDDYLSDKFLVADSSKPTTSKQTLTYAERRRQILKKSHELNMQNRSKSRKAIEEEKRSEGLNSSLFERAKEEEQSGRENKALKMMMRMGFKPGESLGPRKDDSNEVLDKRRDNENHGLTAQLDPDIEGRRGLGSGTKTSLSESSSHHDSPPANSQHINSVFNTNSSGSTPGLGSVHSVTTNILTSSDHSVSKTALQPHVAEAASSAFKVSDKITDSGAAISPSFSAETRTAKGISVDAVTGSSSASTGAVGSQSHHRTVPLAIEIRTGKHGVGLGPKKRALSPGAIESLAKTAKVAEEQRSRENFRDHARFEFEERRAEGRLLSASKTLANLDEQEQEKSGPHPFNILTLNPNHLDTIPPGLLDALADSLLSATRGNPESSQAVRLQAQMRRDALEPLSQPYGDASIGGDNAEEDSNEWPATLPGAILASSGYPNTPTPLPKGQELEVFSEETVEEAKRFLAMPAKQRLDHVLSHLRQNYKYCFWCGTRYQDDEDLQSNCPGEDEDSHG